MKGFLNKVDRWAVKMFKFLRPKANTTSKVEINKEENDDIDWDREKIVLPDQYYVTRTGQIMREPMKRKSYYKRYKVKK